MNPHSVFITKCPRIADNAFASEPWPMLLKLAGARRLALPIDIGFPPCRLPSPGAPLSPREVEWLKLSSRGLMSLNIGAKLGISERTVNFHFGIF